MNRRVALPAIAAVASFMLAFEAPAQTALLRTVDISYANYDIFGNAWNITRQTGDGQIDVEAPTFTADPDHWLIAVPTGRTFTSTTATGEIGMRHIQYQTDPITGVIQTQILEPQGDESLYNWMLFNIDRHGVIASIQSSDLSQTQRRMVTYNFDTEDLYPTSVTNPIGQTELLAIHPGFGVLAARLDPSGILQLWRYDGFGRGKEVISPDGGDMTVSYLAGAPPTIEFHFNSGQTIDFLVDAYFNNVERDWTAFDGSRDKMTRTYNAQNLVASEDGPCPALAATCSGSGSRSYAYDELGRLIKTEAPLLSDWLWTHSGLRTTRQDPERNSRYLVVDQLGRITKSAAIGDGGVEIPTSFTYGPFGVLDAMVDASGNLTKLVHDAWGRILSIQDPDSRTHNYLWSGYDELATMQDADGNVSVYGRDGIGRVNQLSNQDGITQFHWDTAANGVGRVADTVSADGISTSYSYNPVGRLASTTWKVQGTSFTLGYSYDTTGRLASVSYPTQFSLPPFKAGWSYNPSGYLSQVTAGPQGGFFWQENNQNEAGQSVQEALGNGLQTNRGYDSFGRVWHILTTSSGNMPQQLVYDYLRSGSLACRASQLPAFTVAEMFLYDSLDRLREWDVGTEYNGPPPCPIRAAGGSLLEIQQFGYDSIGNLRSRVSTAGSLISHSLSYGQSGAGPHALTTLDAETFKYGNSGNERTWDSGANERTIAYTAFELPHSITITSGSSSAATQFSYDALQQRTLKQYPSGDSDVYIGGLFERRVRNGVPTEVFYVPGPDGRVVAQVNRTPTQDTIRYLHDDGLGSIQAITDQSGALLERRAYEPFGQMGDPGNPANPISPGATDISKGYKGHVEDFELGLINMTGRIYDPHTEHFLTPDPVIQSALRSESLNRYEYAWNNPQKWTDPAGFQNQLADFYGTCAGLTYDCVPSTFGTSDPDPGGFEFKPRSLGSSEAGYEPWDIKVNFGHYKINSFAAVAIEGAEKSEGSSFFRPAHIEDWGTGEWHSQVHNNLQAEIFNTELGWDSFGASLFKFKYEYLSAVSGTGRGDWWLGLEQEYTYKQWTANLHGLTFEDGSFGVGFGASLWSFRQAFGGHVMGLGIYPWVEMRAGIKVAASVGEETSLSVGPVAVGVNVGGAKTADHDPATPFILEAMKPLFMELVVRNGGYWVGGLGGPPLGPLSFLPLDFGGMAPGPAAGNGGQVPSGSSSDNGLFLFWNPGQGTSFGF